LNDKFTDAQINFYFRMDSMGSYQTEIRVALWHVADGEYFDISTCNRGPYQKHEFSPTGRN
jgi:hypothetical protein